MPSTPFCTTLTVLPAPAQNGKDVFTSQSLWVPYGARGVFGGQVIAQALVAAGRTVDPPLGLHSQHCYFLLPALASPAIEYHVDRIRDGRSYANRIVKAVQNGRAIFILSASYALPPKSLPPVRSTTPFSFTPSMRSTEGSTKRSESKSGAGGEEEEGKRPAISHSLRFAVDTSDNPKTVDGYTGDEQSKSQASSIVPYNPPSNGQYSWSESEKASHLVPQFAERYQLPFPADILPPDESPTEEQRWKAFLEEKREEVTDKRRKLIEEYIRASHPLRERQESPVSISAARRRSGATRDGFFSPSIRMVWIHAKLSPGERPSTELAKAMVAYMTDFQFIGTAAQSVGLTWTSQPRLGMLASLDHTTHFYPFPEDFSPGEPLLHVMQSVAADVGSGRGLVRGALYTAKGRLIGTTLQEGVVRASFGKDEHKAEGQNEQGQGEGDGAASNGGARSGVRRQAKL